MKSFKRLLALTSVLTLANSGSATAALPPRLSVNGYASDYKEQLQ